MQLVLSLLPPLTRGALFQTDAADRYAIFVACSKLTVLAARDRDVAVICGGVRGPLQILRWDHLTALTLTAGCMSQAAVIALVKAPLPNLAVLCLKQVALQPNQAWHLANNFASQLRQLELCSTSLTASCLASLTQNHRVSWPLLKSLKLDGSPLDGQHMEQLVPVFFPKLWILALSSCNLTHTAVAAFTHADWSLLRIISLSGNALAVCDFQRLSQANLHVLQQLYLADTNMSAMCVFHLVRSNWPLLQTLDLSHNALDEQAMQHMQGSPVHLSWQVMMHLTLSNNQLPLGCISCLTRLQCHQLRTLRLSNVGLTAVAFLSLNQGCWPVLEVLKVTKNDLLKKLYNHYTHAPNHNMQLPLPLPDSNYWTVYLLNLCQGFWPALTHLHF